MDSFTCPNPVIVQDVMQFGLKAWIFPTVLLLMGWLGLLYQRWGENPKLSKLFYPRPRLVAILGSLAFIGLGHLNFMDGAMKREKLSSGNFGTYTGVLKSTEVHHMYRSLGLIFDEIDFYIEGKRSYKDGATYPIDGYSFSNRVTTKNAFIGYGGKSCFSRFCGLRVGDKVRIKSILGDTLRIEKCRAS